MSGRSKLVGSTPNCNAGTSQVEFSGTGEIFGLVPVLSDDAITGGEDRETSADSEESLSEQGGGGFLSLTYAGVFLFCSVSFFRPQDYIEALALVPLAKITAVIAGLSLFLVLISGALRVHTEMKWLLALFGWLTLCIPFSFWRGGSFHVVVLGFGKLVFTAVAASAAVNNWSRLRRLMVLQTLAMLAMGVLAFAAERRSGRMYGSGNLFSDPNDFALQLCIVLPFCVALLRTSTSWIGKLWWLTSIFTILVAIVATYSRGGLIALVATLFFIWRRFKPGLRVVLPFGVLALVIATAFIASKAPSYVARVSTVMDLESDASAHQRKTLLVESLRQTVLHPVFGVGPGQFEEVSRQWLQTHNTYTQLSAEAGLPALVLFLLLLRSGFRRLSTLENDGTVAGSTLISALQCSLAGYAVGALFLATAYWLAPYLLLAYIAAASEARVQCRDTTEP